MAIVNGIVTVIKAIINVRPAASLLQHAASDLLLTFSPSTGCGRTRHGHRLVPHMRQSRQAWESYNKRGLNERNETTVTTVENDTFTTFKRQCALPDTYTTWVLIE